MKVTYAESNVLGSGGLGQTQSFQIRTNAHAFKMLSSGLYSDKIKAVLREIGCNAHDAHISVGKKDLPIEVKLPNRIDPQFWIRDHGPGLSDADVMGLYTTYFSSTKQDSNDFTGGFGLGSKSPFSYTDSFMVVSYHGGLESTYTCHIGNDGSPKIAKMGEAPTTETGIKVSFSVPDHNFVEFQQKAQEVYQYFNPVPTILGGDDIRPIVYERDTGAYAICQGGNYGSVKVQMGNVIYPVKIDQVIKGNVELARAFVYSRGIVFRMPIGTVAVAASREELQYDPASVEAIQKSMLMIVKDICTEIEAAYKNVTDWKSRCKFRALFSSMNLGVQLNAKIMTLVGIQNADRLAEACDNSSVSISTVRQPKDTIFALYVTNRHRTNIDRQLASEYNKTLNVPLIENIVVASGDAKQAHIRLRKALLDNKYTNVIAVYPTPGKVVPKAEIDDFIAEIVKMTGNIECVDMATLDRPAIVRTTKAKITKGTFPDGEVFTDLGQPKVKASTITDKVYIRVRLNQRWGRYSPEFIFDETKDTRFDQYSWPRFVGTISEVARYAKLAYPVFVTPVEFKRMKMAENPAWTQYKDYLQSRLLDSTALDALKLKIKDYVPKIDFRYGGNSPLECLVKLKNDLPDMYNQIVPVLKRVSIHQEIEKVYKVSTDPAPTQVSTKIPELISNYRDIAKYLTDDMTDIPDLDKSESIVNTKVGSKFRQLNFALIASVAQVSEKACVTFLTEALTT